MDKFNLILIAHTHWDREWYYTFDKFRYRLVKCLDSVLDLLKDPRYGSFMLDGQVAPLDDYLELRPEKALEVKELISKNRLIIGPWYVQPDEFLVHEESLIRNLMYGRMRAKEYGGFSNIGYLPDTFGHTAQLPQILKGFGIDTFVFHRGMGEEFEKVGTPFSWVAPDGSEVSALFLYGGYCNLAWLPPDPDAAAEMVRELYELWRKYLRIRSIPGMVGCDHHLPKDYLPKISEELSRRNLPVRVFQGTLDEVLTEARKARLGRVSGELLSSRYHWVLYGVWSTRTYLKQVNFECESLMIYSVEPLWSIAYVLTGIYPEKEIWQAWRYLLLCHPHDSICGCSVDEVHREVEARLMKVRELGEELLHCTGRKYGSLEGFLAGRAGYSYEWHAMPLIASKVDLSFAGDSAYVIAFNTLPWRRRAVVKLRIKPYKFTALMLDELARVSSRNLSKDISKLIEKGVVISFDLRGASLKSAEGELIPCQARELEDGTIEFTWVDELPATGYKAYAVEPGIQPVTAMRWGQAYIENEYFRVEFDLENGGALKLTDKRSGEVYEGLVLLEDGGDVGDEYDYSPPLLDHVLTSRGFRANFNVVESGPVYIRAKVSYTLKLPVAASLNGKSRSKEEVNIPVEIYATLFSGIPRLDLDIIIDNRAKDHRLRVVFPTGVKSAKHLAKTHYMVIERPNKSPFHYRRGEEKASIHTWPTRLWVSVEDGRRGLCVVAKGLYEYEVRERDGAEIVYTLLRSVGWLSRSDLLTRPGHAGPEIQTPDAQCPGLRKFELCIIPYSGSWAEAGVHRTALEYVAPGLAHEDIPHKGDLPSQYSLLEVNSDLLLFSALKKSLDGRGFILRIYNPTPREVPASVKLNIKSRRVFRTRLDETPVEELMPSSELKLKIMPYKVETIKVEL
ncbi:MAG: glycoside hydrolase family 38 C-terminal domain-containing protein [Thermofilaceae archaeon]